MNKKNCKEALDIYKKFLDSTDRVSAFLKVAEVRRRRSDKREGRIYSFFFVELLECWYGQR